MLSRPLRSAFNAGGCGKTVATAREKGLRGVPRGVVDCAWVRMKGGEGKEKKKVRVPFLCSSFGWGDRVPRWFFIIRSKRGEGREGKRRGESAARPLFHL